MSKSFFVLISVTFLLFVPIFLEANIHYDMNKRKFVFSLLLYKIIKLIGGYVATYNGGIAIHLTKKKAVLIPYTEIENERKKFSFMKTFRLKSFNLITETGAEYFIPVSIAHILSRIYFFIKNGKKENIENNLWLTDGDVLRISLHSVLFFNLFILLSSFFKFIKEKISNICTKKMRKSTI